MTPAAQLGSAESAGSNPYRLDQAVDGCRTYRWNEEFYSSCIKSCDSRALQHTHQRHDRDNYVTINEENVQDYYKYALAPEDDIALGTFDFPYDYLSIMHYDKVAFSNGNGETIIPKEEFEM